MTEDSKKNIDLSEVTLSKDETDIITEEYQLWKQNTPLLYDLLLSYARTWPALSVDWMPQVAPSPDCPNADIHQLLVGHNVSGGEIPHIELLQMNLPKPNAPTHLAHPSNKLSPLHCVGYGDIPVNF